MNSDQTTPLVEYFSHGRFVVRKKLGQGGWGDVYLAFDLALEREVAIKRLQENLAADPAVCAIFLHEARTAAKVKDANAVAIHDVLEDDLCLVLEYVNGPNLAKYLQFRNRLSNDEISHVLRDVCSGLQSCHDAGVIHRDLKPANLLLELKAEELTSYRDNVFPRSLLNSGVKIADFGLSKLADHPMTMTLASLGTLFYMSPEQVMGDPSTVETDIYTLGVIAYELFSGKLPFPEGNIRRHHVETAPPPIAGQSQAVNQALQKALAKKPCDRYRSAHEFFVSVEKALASPLEETPGRKEPAAESPRKTTSPMNPKPPTNAEIAGETFLSRFDSKVRALFHPKTDTQEFRRDFGQVRKIEIKGGFLAKKLVLAAVCLKRETGEPSPKLIEQIKGINGLDLEPKVEYHVGLYRPDGWPEAWKQTSWISGEASFYLVSQDEGHDWHTHPREGRYWEVFLPETKQDGGERVRRQLDGCDDLKRMGGTIELAEFAKAHDVEKELVEGAIGASGGRYRLISHRDKTYIRRAEL